jgi:hypothetical protein
VPWDSAPMFSTAVKRSGIRCFSSEPQTARAGSGSIPRIRPAGETTLKRPIINTRDEPHADPEKYRRLHVIIGDANMSEISSYLKLGTTSLVLAMIEDRFLGSDLAVESPVAELRAISHDRRARRGQGHRVPARGHQGLLPRPLPAQVPGRGGHGFLGFGHLRHPRRRVPTLEPLHGTKRSPAKVQI